MFIELLLRGALVGMGVAVIAGPLGCFLVWRKMAYFGDTLAHSALLGVALGLAWELDLNLSVLIVCVTLALLLVLLQSQSRLASDTLLGIMAHSSLSLGMVIFASANGVGGDLMSYLFGDILAVQQQELYLVYGIGAMVLLALIVSWPKLLAATVDEDLARVEGRQVFLLRALLMVLIAVMIAIAMKVVGVLLITSLLIIPAATARCFSKTPEGMAIGAACLGAVSILLGLAASLYQDIPSGPAIVLTESLFFLLANLLFLRSRA